MKFIQITLLSVLILPLLSCSGNRNTNQTTGNVQRNTDAEQRAIDRDYEARRAEDEDREAVLRRSKDRFKESSTTCEDEDRDHDCRDICKDIYKLRKDRSDCEELSIAQIERLEELHEWLEDPDEDDLEGIDFNDFDVYLNISIDPLDRLIPKYSKNEVRDFLIWIITNADFAEILEKEEDDYTTLGHLLKELNGGSSITDANMHEVFLAKLDGNEKLMEVLIQSGEDTTMDWFLDYINEKHDDCEDDTEDEDCFAVYCKIGNGISRDDRDDWLAFENFEKYIEDIIESGVNADDSTEPYHWGGNNNLFEDIGDIDDWVEDLCENTTGSGNDLTS